jgi:hypothetical protein
MQLVQLTFSWLPVAVAVVAPELPTQLAVAVVVPVD